MNELKISGDKEDLLKVKSFLKNEEEETELSFCNIIPYPENNSGGYEWCVSNWGTKWGACECSVSVEEGRLNYFFDTAWTPMGDVLLRKLSELFPNLTFYLFFSEPGVGFEGEREYENGECLEDNMWDYDDDEECE